MTDDRENTVVPVLDVRDLSVRFRMRGGRDIAAVTDARFSVAPGECLALVGESGCGKSVLASALLGLLPANAATTGSAVLGGDTDLLTAGEDTLARTVRGRRIGLVPQSPAAHLTPVRTVRAQLEESLRELTGARGGELPNAAAAAAARASFPEGHLDRYPHELSGGLAQRAATALALIGDAPLLLADEPTTGLDRDLVERTVDELRRHTDEGRALLIITHDLGRRRTHRRPGRRDVRRPDRRDRGGGDLLRRPRPPSCGRIRSRAFPCRNRIGSGVWIWSERVGRS
ncbi:Vitamin B12 import ATP-binding protein BtuD [Streptomyces badius]